MRQRHPVVINATGEVPKVSSTDDRFSREALSTYFERQHWRAFLEGRHDRADEWKELSIAAYRGDLDAELADDAEVDW